MSDGTLLGAMQDGTMPTPGADTEKTRKETLWAELLADVKDADDDGMEAVYVKYDEVLKDLSSQRQVDYYKHQLALKYGAKQIKDSDTRMLWVAIRKLLFAMRTLSGQQ